MEIVGVAAGLLRTGRLAEHDAFVTMLAERHRARGGPATFLHWSQFMLGYAALFRNDYAQAEQCFDRAAAVEVPEGTFSANRPADARAAFRRRDRTRAFDILHDHVIELLVVENNMVATRLAYMRDVLDVLADDRTAA